MTFSYVEGGEKKYGGNFRVVYKGNGSDSTYTFNWILTREKSEKDDWVYCYADDFESSFTQFTTIKEEQDLGVTDGRVYSHIYRPSELPFALGTYVKEGAAFKRERDDYEYANRYQLPAGTYYLDESTYFEIIMPKPYAYALFAYHNGVETVEGVYWTANDKKTIYLFLDHGPYDYVKKQDRSDYDTTFSNYYPPDFYLRGNFDVADNSFTVSELYHHGESKTAVPDSVWKFGTYSQRA